MLKHRYIQKFIAAISLSLLCSLGAAPALADSSIQSVAQSYNAPSSLQKGMIVAVNDHDANAVVAATADSDKKMQGVVVSASDAPVTLSSDDANNHQVYVAASGRYDVLVSNENGALSNGDYVAVSSLAGVGMKADGNQREVLGRAVSGFNGGQASESTATLSNGQRVAIGRVTVDIAINANPLASQANNGVPPFLQRIVSSVNNKPLAAWRIYVALAIIAAATIVAATLLSSGVHSGLIAIGRNPLARKSISRGLLQVIVSSLFVFILGLVGSFLVLKL